MLSNEKGKINQVEVYEARLWNTMSCNEKDKVKAKEECNHLWGSINPQSSVKLQSMMDNVPTNY